MFFEMDLFDDEKEERKHRAVPVESTMRCNGIEHVREITGRLVLERSLRHKEDADDVALSSITMEAEMYSVRNLHTVVNRLWNRSLDRRGQGRATECLNLCDSGVESDVLNTVSSDRIELIGRYMGSMAQCRVHGEALHHAGVIPALVSLLFLNEGGIACRRETSLSHDGLANSGEQTSYNKYTIDAASDTSPHATRDIDAVSHVETSALKMEAPRGLSSKADAIDSNGATMAASVASAAAGAIRDLSCARADIRNDVRECGGAPALTALVRRSRGVTWEELLDRGGGVELFLLTAVCGAIRNVSHSSRENAQAFHEAGATEELSWRLLHGRSRVVFNGDRVNSPPMLVGAGSPFREASFRAAGALINIAEKSEACAASCAADATLVRVLVEAWGGKHKRSLALHLGLVAILRRACAGAERNVMVNGVVREWRDILEREERRRVTAQRREDERKRMKNAGVLTSAVQ